MDDLIEQLAATPSALAHLVAEADDAALDAAAPGQWSARTILAHFRDDEYLCTRVALERMLAEEQPELRFIDGADWEPRRNRERDRKEWLLADFALQRQASLGVLRLVSASQAQRTGRRDGRELTIEQLLSVWTRHDREHLTELERLVGETVDQARQRRARWE
jgi:hypothetical protein